MKAFKTLATAVVSVVILWSLSSCEQTISVESAVHEDGSIDRTILYSDVDSGQYKQRGIFDVDANGWSTEVSFTKGREDEREKRQVRYSKHFNSVDDMNSEMNSSDTLFKIKSEFEKKFRWFYTYITYSDTYVAINRFNDVKTEDYFTPEDYTFIHRLPAEGKKISNADSIYLIKLNEKIYDHFAIRGIFEQQFKSLLASFSKPEDQRWQDTLNRKKEILFQMLVKHKDDGPDDFMVALADSIGVPQTAVSKKTFAELLKKSEGKINFMSTAAEGKYTHSIKMPWNVVDTNADSVAGNHLTWQPPVIKFMLNDYTMYAESRQMNYWAVILSATLVFITALAFVKSKKTAKAS